jgi:hypothetical protein
MKRSIIALAMIVATLSVYAASKVKHDQYKVLELEIVKSQPEEFKNKKVCYESTYSQYMTVFPAYAEKNSIKPGKHYWLVIQPNNLPVIVKKTDEMNELIPKIKRGTKVKVYGKIKKFRVTAKHAMLPTYYLELADIQILEEPEGDVDNDDQDGKNQQTYGR